MTNREHLIALAAATALVAFSGIAKADDYSLPDTERFARSEEPASMTCAQAQSYAWFVHQLELTDGTANSVDRPAECSQDLIANLDAGTPESVPAVEE